MKSGASPLPETNPADAIVAASLVKRYKKSLRPSLNALSLEVRCGEFFGLLGPNGAGKTTAISIITGLFPPDGGTVQIMGLSFRDKRRAIQQRIGLVPQDIGLYSTLTAGENLAFFGRLCGLTGKGLAEKIQQCLVFARLTEYASQQVATFSTGMKRRLNLAVGLLNDPEILVLDEPCVGIDAQSRHLIHEQLKALNTRGTTIIYTTHYMEEAQQLCSRVGIIDNGRLVTQGSPAELLKENGMANLEELFLHLTGKELRDT